LEISVLWSFNKVDSFRLPSRSRVQVIARGVIAIMRHINRVYSETPGLM